MTTSSDRRLLLQGLSAATAGTLFGIPISTLAAAAKGGVVVIGITQKARHLNSAVQSGTATMSPAAQIFASPLRMNDKWQPQPYLAKSWEVSEDARSIRLNLHEGATFHDGKPITSADVAFSVETVQKNHPFKSMLAPVNAVTLDGDHAAIIRLSQPHPALVLAMTTSFMPIIPKHIFGDGKDLKSHPRNNNPVGSGPFKLVDFKPGTHIILERYDQFFLKGHPLLDKVIFKNYKDSSSLLLALEKGEIDVNPELVEANLINRAKKMPNVNVHVGAAPAIGPLIWIAFNTANEKLADKRVRQAINYAIDKKYITEILLGGVHKRSTGPITSGSPFYSSKVNAFNLDLKKANALLDAAGKKPDANGIRMELEIDNIPGPAAMKTVQEYMVPALAKVGIKVKVRASPDFPTWARRVSSHEFEMTVDSVWNWGDPVIGVHRTWDSNNVRKGVIWSNTQGYKNEQVDKILAEAGGITAQAKRKAAYAKLQELVVDDCPVAFIYEMTFHYGVNKRMSGDPKSVWGNISPYDDVFIKA